MTIEEIKFLITNRRSTYPKQFSGKRIDDSTVLEWLELANWAPNHKHTEPWRFMVFSGESMLNLVDFHEAHYLKKTPVELQNGKKLEKFRMVKERTSHIIAVSFEADEAKRLPEWEEVAATAMAVQNLYLGLEAFEMAGYWSTGNGLDYEDTRTYLNLPLGQKHLGWFYLGTPDGSALPTRVRKPMANKVKWVR